jgi:hypothetical protein
MMGLTQAYLAAKKCVEAVSTAKQVCTYDYYSHYCHYGNDTAAAAAAVAAAVDYCLYCC